MSRRFGFPLLPLALFGLVHSLGLSSCSSGGDEGGDNGDSAPATRNPSVRIELASESDVLVDPETETFFLELMLSLEDFDPGVDGQLVLSIDGLVEQTSLAPSFDPITLGPGQYSIEVELLDLDGGSLDPPVRDEVALRVLSLADPRIDAAVETPNWFPLQAIPLVVRQLDPLVREDVVSGSVVDSAGENPDFPIDVELVATAENDLVFVVPELPAGSWVLTVFVQGVELRWNFQTAEPIVVEDPDALIEFAVDTLRERLERPTRNDVKDEPWQQDLAARAAEKLDEFLTHFDALSAEEREILARLIVVNAPSLADKLPDVQRQEKGLVETVLGITDEDLQDNNCEEGVRRLKIYLLGVAGSAGMSYGAIALGLGTGGVSLVLTLAAQAVFQAEFWDALRGLKDSYKQVQDFCYSPDTVELATSLEKFDDLKDELQDEVQEKTYRKSHGVLPLGLEDEDTVRLVSREPKQVWLIARAALENSLLEPGLRDVRAGLLDSVDDPPESLVDTISRLPTGAFYEIVDPRTHTIQNVSPARVLLTTRNVPPPEDEENPEEPAPKPDLEEPIEAFLLTAYAFSTAGAIIPVTFELNGPGRWLSEARIEVVAEAVPTYSIEDLGQPFVSTTTTPEPLGPHGMRGLCLAGFRSRPTQEQQPEIDGYGNRQGEEISIDENGFVELITWIDDREIGLRASWSPEGHRNVAHFWMPLADPRVNEPGAPFRNPFVHEFSIEDIPGVGRILTFDIPVNYDPVKDSLTTELYEYRADDCEPLRRWTFVDSERVEALDLHYEEADGKRKLASYSVTPFRNRRKEGIERVYYPDGTPKAEYPYVGNVLHGMVNEYYESGSIRHRSAYQEGLREGWTRGYYESGAIEFEGIYKDDRREGTHTNYDESGVSRRIITYKAGLWDGPYRTYYPSGVLSFEVEYEEDLAQGPYKTYYPSGADQEIGNFVDDQLHGPWRRLDEGGRPLIRGQYSAGQEVGTWTYCSYGEDGAADCNTETY
ncbi:MAG: toxin-antitoxin system YwqK family antitoxin [Planctomycetota bacterium]